LSNILARECLYIYWWAKTFIPFRIVRKGPVMVHVIRRGARVKMRRNRVWASFVKWLRGTHVD